MALRRAKSWVACGVLALFVIAARAEESAADPTIPADCAKGALAPLVRWVELDGTNETLPAYLLGLDAEDVPVRQKAYRNTTTKLVHALDVVIAKESCTLVFILDDGGTATTWIADRDGRVERTYYMSHGEENHDLNQIVPNEQHAGEYEEVKQYFLDKLPQPEISPVARMIRRLLGLH